MNNIVLATSNPGKIAEFTQLLSPINCIPQQTLGIHDAEETGLSFIENAILKARHASKIAKKPALADDSGLVVPALNGEPGIYSARYNQYHDSSCDNIDLLLQRLQAISAPNRDAYFYCAIAIVQYDNDPMPMIATGLFAGSIAKERRGTAGFGYDPIFYVNEYHCTAAQLPDALKNKISHRARALQQLQQYLSYANTCPQIERII